MVAEEVVPRTTAVVWLFSDVPLYAMGFLRRWRANLPIAAFALAGGVMWAIIDFVVHVYIRFHYHLGTLPIYSVIAASGVDAVFVSCLWFAAFRTSAERAWIRKRHREFEDEVRQGLQIIVYSVALMDPDGKFMKQMERGLHRIEKSMFDYFPK